MFLFWKQKISRYSNLECALFQQILNCELLVENSFCIKVCWQEEQWVGCKIWHPWTSIYSWGKSSSGDPSICIPSPCKIITIQNKNSVFSCSWRIEVWVSLVSLGTLAPSCRTWLLSFKHGSIFPWPSCINKNSLYSPETINRFLRFFFIKIILIYNQIQ